MTDINMGFGKSLKFLPDTLPSQMCFQPYHIDKNYLPYNQHNEYENQYNMAKQNYQIPNYNAQLNTNYSIGMPTAAMGGHQLAKNPMSDYEQAEYLNQILRLPYQIVMPPAEINQSISINNLPSLNDLAIRTGINTGMGTIFTQRSMAAPGPMPLGTPQLILPLSSLYSNCTKDHLQLPIPIIEEAQKYQAGYYKQQEAKLPSMMPNIMREDYSPNPAMMAERARGSNWCSTMENEKNSERGLVPTPIGMYSTMQGYDLGFKNPNKN